MKKFPSFDLPPVFVEITQSSLKVLREHAGIELALERTADGKITVSCRETVVAELGKFLGNKSWQPRRRAICAISLRGVILRWISLPATAKEEFNRVLRLQVESEFPLSPDELAWGWREVPTGSDQKEFLIIAVRKEIIEEISSLLAAAGLKVEFTLAAIARNALCPQPEGTHALLEIGPNDSELVCFENGVADSVRIFLTSPEEALKAAAKFTGSKTIFLGGTNIPADNAGRRLEIPTGAGCSAATLGLKKLAAKGSDLFLLRVQPKPAKTTLQFSWAEHRPVLVRAAVLLGILLLLPFIEPLVLKPFLAHKLAKVKAEKEHFAALVDPELRFLQSLKQNQPPYLDALYVFSKAAPPGLHLDSISLGQHGDISLRAALQNAQQVMDFRAKLIDSGFFDSIVVEEQTPSPDRRVNVRLTAQWKPAGTRAAVKLDPASSETGKMKMAGGSPMNSAIPMMQ